MSAVEGIAVNILVVDDRAENRAALRAILSSPDYRVVEAGCAQDALRELLSREFAVILLDVVMPDMNGFELAAAIRRRERTSSVPILFLTAEATDLDRACRGYEVGAVDYLVKPLVPIVVQAKVAVFAELHRKEKKIENQAALLLEAQKKQNEFRLMELQLASERRYRVLAEAVPHIVWRARPDGSVEYFNWRWFEYTGRLTLNATGTWQHVIHSEDLSRWNEAWREALSSVEMFQVECRLRKADGTFRWHLCLAVPERSATGQALSWMGTFTDIDDQKRVQAVLSEFKGTLDAVLDAVFIFDTDVRRFLYVNQGTSALLGYSGDELSRMRPVEIAVDDDGAGLRELIAPLREGAKDVTTIEMKFRRKDARVVPAEVSLQYIPVDGGRVVAIARDISDRLRARLEREQLYQAAVDAVRSRDEFLSVASHELRTPLSSLQLQIENLLRPSRKDPAAVLRPEHLKKKLEMSLRQTGRLTQLVSELMDVSRIRAGRLRLKLEEADLCAIAREVAERLGEDAARARTPVTVTTQTKVLGKWDRMRVEQVLTNLMTNALKFGAGHPVEVDVEGNGVLARLVVRDRGIGIPEGDLERIFERYEQATSARGYGGLGLGLYIARQIVDAHGGTLRVESAPGAGSTFTVELPVEPSPKHERPGGRLPAEPARPPDDVARVPETATD